MMNKNYEDINLLPRHFKNVAFMIIGLSILFIIIGFSIELPLEKELIMSITNTGILLSLLILAMTRIKNEDELTIKIRLKAFAGAFVFGVGYAKLLILL